LRSLKTTREAEAGVTEQKLISLSKLPFESHSAGAVFYQLAIAHSRAQGL
jgi:hypothetical protein